MSHFGFPRTRRSTELQNRNSVILDDNVLESEYPIINSEGPILLNSENRQSTSSSSNSSVVSVADSSDSSTILAPRQPQRSNTIEERRCWICFGDSSDSQGKWVKPCKCSLEAHQACLLDWIAENQKASPNKKVNCPQCATTYHLAEKNSITLSLLSLVDTFVRTSTPYITVVGLGCSLLITCTTYGAFSVMTLFGVRDGERLIGNPNEWTYKTWIGLPLIPVLLIASKTRYGDAILPVAAVSVLRATGATPHNIRLTWPLSPALTIGIMPWVRLLYKNAYRLAQQYITKNLSIQDPSTSTNSRGRSSSSNNEISDRERLLEFNMINGRTTNTSSIGIALVGAMLWPVISNGVGSVLYRSKWIRQNFPEPFQRNVLGGCLFIVAKDVGSLIYKYQKIRQYRSRRVKSYEEVLKSTPNRHQQ